MSHQPSAISHFFSDYPLKYPIPTYGQEFCGLSGVKITDTTIRNFYKQDLNRYRSLPLSQMECERLVRIGIGQERAP